MTFTDISAAVDEGELSQPLLGMSFLKRVGSIEIKDGTLTLHR
jgi:predicted aspartyl protease